ncbi:MAG: AroM family protein [Candidatus Aminicenantes bacterium]|nr:MAG: AroM family protein [Candidatus Aminicenantes bacterium]
MKPVKVGLFTIGQSPRLDVVPEIAPLLLPNIEIVEEGLLDGIPQEEIDLLKPEFGEKLLITRLKDGSQVQLSEKKISSMIHEVIDRMRTKKDVRAVGVLCTHDFHESRFSFPVIFPHHVLNSEITQTLQINHLGVVIPLEDQVRMASGKWDIDKATVEVKSPYAEGIEWEEIAHRFIQENVEAVILDCIGYTEQDKEDLQNFLSSPILLPRAVLAQAINQLF